LGAGSSKRQACWGCSGGVLEVPSGLVGDHIHLIQLLGLRKTPYFEKLAVFPDMHVEMG
jgi:hypothetical protein